MYLSLSSDKGTELFAAPTSEAASSTRSSTTSGTTATGVTCWLSSLATRKLGGWSGRLGTWTRYLKYCKLRHLL